MSIQKTAVFPGSFDPITKGHVAILKKALPLFDKVIIAIGTNVAKNNYFDLDIRKKQLRTVFAEESKIEVISYEGLTVDFCKKHNANFIIRGLRDVKDFEYEKSIAIMNNKISEDIETIFFMTDPEFSAINSAIVRDILRNGGNVSQFLPDQISTSL
jgi:pantetheine-phosphate adenylyltransferase|tara:strand:- start:6240 stop:6710 length:471 start_codon:yes stop_codon:yes gene_type:complete